MRSVSAMRSGFEYNALTMGTVQRWVLVCDACAWEWVRRGEEDPLQCPKCRSRHWDDSRTKSGENLAPRCDMSADRKAARPSAPGKLPASDREPTDDEIERDRRRQKKADRHRELKTDAAEAVAVSAPEPLAALAAKMQTKADDHHPACRCYRCRPPKQD